MRKQLRSCFHCKIRDSREYNSLNGKESATHQSTHLTSKIDERIELATIICRLVYFPENELSQYKPYSETVNNYVKHYRSNCQIAFQIEIFRQKYRIDYETIVSSALTWSIKDGKVIFNPENTPFKSKLQETLSKKEHEDFIEALNEFYNKASFSKFYESQQSLYNEAERLYNTEVLAKFQPKIYEDFYGVSFEDVKIYISLLNGQVNYSNPQDKSVIMSGFSTSYNLMTGEEALGVLNPEPIYLLVCNLSDIFLHTYVALLQIEAEKSTASYYKYTLLLFDKSHYTEEDIFSEQISKLGALLYLEATNNMWFFSRIETDKQKGFMWQNEMWAYLDNFKKDRTKYPYFKDFLPALTSEYRRILYY